MTPTKSIGIDVYYYDGIATITADGETIYTNKASREELVILERNLTKIYACLGLERLKELVRIISGNNP